MQRIHRRGPDRRAAPLQKSMYSPVESGGADDQSSTTNSTAGDGENPFWDYVAALKNGSNFTNGTIVPAP